MFDIIIGNPPYVVLSSMNDSYRDKVKSNFMEIKYNSINISTIFVIISIKIISKSGKILFVINRSVLSNLYDSQTLFKVYQNYRIFPEEKIGLSNNLFGQYSPHASIIAWESDNKEVFYINKTDLKRKLMDYGIWVCSSACTGKNKVYIVKAIKKYDDKIETYRNGKTYLIERGILKYAVNPNRAKLDNVTHDNFIIFPYDENLNIFDEEIMNVKYPLTMQYLADHRAIIDRPDKVAWYSYTRRPSKCLTMPKILVPNIVQNFKLILIKEPDYVHYKSYAIVYKYDIEKLYKAIDFDKYEKLMLKSAHHMGDNWYSIKAYMIEDILMKVVNFNDI